MSSRMFKIPNNNIFEFGDFSIVLQKVLSFKFIEKKEKIQIIFLLPIFEHDGILFKELSFKHFLISCFEFSFMKLISFTIFEPLLETCSKLFVVWFNLEKIFFDDLGIFTTYFYEFFFSNILTISFSLVSSYVRNLLIDFLVICGLLA